MSTTTTPRDTPTRFAGMALLVLILALGIARRTGVGTLPDLAFPALVFLGLWVGLLVHSRRTT